MSRKRASLQAENRLPHATRGPPNFQPSGPLSSIRDRPQIGLRPHLLCPVEWQGPFGWSVQPRLRDWRKRAAIWTVSHKENVMPRKKKIEGKAVARILDAKTREVVGYLFKWNNGRIDPKWKDDIQRAEEDIVYDYE